MPIAAGFVGRFGGIAPGVAGSGGGTVDGQYFSDDSQANEYFSDDAQATPYKTKD